MSTKTILSLKWNNNHGEAEINFDGMEKLFGIEKADFLNDVIQMLSDYRDECGNNWVNDYAEG